MTNLRLATALLLGLGAVATAQAAGLYAGGSLGQSHYGGDIGDVPNGIAITELKRNGTGFKLFVGGALSPGFAVEGGYVDLGKAKITAQGGGLTVDADAKGTGLYLDAVGKVPVSTDFSLFGKLGIFSGKASSSASGGGVSASDSEHGTSYTFGFGGEYALSKTVALRAEWERFRFKLSGGSSDVDLLSVGVTFSF